MKFLSLVWLVLLVIVCVNCSPNSKASNLFTKQVEVFGVRIIVVTASSDDKVLHSANVRPNILTTMKTGYRIRRKLSM